MTEFQIFSAGMACGAIILTVIALGTDAPSFEKRLVVRCLKFIGALAVFVAVLAIAGCAGFSDPAKPRNEAEMFPVNCGTPAKGVVREAGPSGLAVNTGTAPSQVCLFDDGGRFVEQWGMEGADRFIRSSNGQAYPQVVKRQLSPGCYNALIFPFYKYMPILRTGPVFVMLPKQSQRICTTNSDTTHLVYGMYVNWWMRMGTDIPAVQTGATIPGWRDLLQIQLPPGF